MVGVFLLAPVPPTAPPAVPAGIGAEAVLSAPVPEGGALVGGWMSSGLGVELSSTSCPSAGKVLLLSTELLTKVVLALLAGGVVASPP